MLAPNILVELIHNRSARSLHKPLKLNKFELLRRTGTHPKTAQELMRHGDINLTMSRYAHTLRGQEANAVQSLPDLSKPSEQSRQKKATGTDDSSVDAWSAYKKLTKNIDSDSTPLSSAGTNSVQAWGVHGRVSSSGKASNKADLGTDCPPLSSDNNGGNETGPRRTRTFDQWIMSPLL